MLKKFLIFTGGFVLLRAILIATKTNNNTVKIDPDLLPRIVGTTAPYVERDLSKYPNSIQIMRDYLVIKSMPFDEYKKFIDNLQQGETQPVYYMWYDFFELKKQPSIHDPWYKMYMDIVYRLTKSFRKNPY